MRWRSSGRCPHDAGPPAEVLRDAARVVEHGDDVASTMLCALVRVHDRCCLGGRTGSALALGRPMAMVTLITSVIGAWVLLDTFTRPSGVPGAIGRCQTCSKPRTMAAIRHVAAHRAVRVDRQGARRRIYATAWRRWSSLRSTASARRGHRSCSGARHNNRELCGWPAPPCALCAELGGAAARSLNSVAATLQDPRCSPRRATGAVESAPGGSRGRHRPRTAGGFAVLAAMLRHR